MNLGDDACSSNENRNQPDEDEESPFKAVFGWDAFLGLNSLNL
jgi:hypothetical protein